MNDMTRDATRRFVIGAGAVRGEYVRLELSWRAILARRSYPGPVTSLLGESLAACALFTATLKMLQSDGRVSIQIREGRPVSLLVAECRADFSMRAMARVDEKAALNADGPIRDLIAGASFALAVDPGGDYDSYQSLIPVESPSLAGTLNDYMARSEQLESHFVLAASQETCAGLLVQKIPTQGGHAAADADPDAWNRIRTLAASATRDELLTLGDEELLHRLFHQEEVRLMPPRPVTFACRCSKERVGGVLRMLGVDEVRGLLADRRTIEVSCEFCGLAYSFTAEEAWAAITVAAP